MLLFFSATYILAQSAAPGTPMRWGVYAVPALSWFLALVTANKRFLYDRRLVGATLIYCLIAGLSLAVNPRLKFNGVRDVLIIAGFLLTFVPMFPMSPRQVSSLLVLLPAAVIPSIWGGPESDAARAMTGARGGVGVLDFAGSQGILESTVAFPMTALAIFFFIRRKWPLFFVAVIMSVVTFKRIAFLGLFAALGFYAVASRMERSSLPNRRRIVQALALLVLISLASAGMTFDTTYDLMSDALSIQARPDQITLGRYSTSRNIRELIHGHSIARQLVGNGPGSSTNLPDVDTTHNPHNDYLKIYYEYGLLGAAGIIAMLFVLYAGSAATLSLLVFNAFLMLTDNTLIYFFHQFVCLAIVRCFRCDGAEVGPVGGMAGVRRGRG